VQIAKENKNTAAVNGWLLNSNIEDKRERERIE
jgi:hypothetical protein